MIDQSEEIRNNYLSSSAGELPSPKEAFEWPKQAMREHNWPEAAKRWAVLRNTYPDQPQPWVQAAISLLKANDLENVESLLLYARQHFPNRPNALIQSAELAIRRKEWDNAESLLVEAREQFPDFLHTWMKSAEVAILQENFSLALEYNKKARQCLPASAASFIQYAELAMHEEQWEQALSRWEELRNRFPNEAAGYLRSAEIEQQLGHFKEARRLRLAHGYDVDILASETTDQITRAQSGAYASFVRLLELITTKAIFNLRSEVQRNYLSYGWWMLEPLLYMVVYYVVFGLLLQRGGENFIAFLLTGLIPWMWFNKAISGSSNSILAGQNLILLIGLPSVVFPLVSLLQVTLKQIPVFILLVVFILSQDFAIGPQWWALIPVIVVQILIILALACTVAAVIPFVRDLSYLVPTGLTFLMFMSGIFYDYRIVSEEWQSLFLLNPVAFLLKCYREIFIEGVLPDLSTLGLWGIGSAAAWLLLLLAYQRLRYIYPRIILQ